MDTLAIDLPLMKEGDDNLAPQVMVARGKEGTGPECRDAPRRVIPFVLTAS